MAKSKQTKVDLVKIRRHGEAMILPPSLSLKEAKAVIERQIEYEEGDVSVNAPIGGFLPDAAHAFSLALTKIYGWVNGSAQPGLLPE